MITLEVNLYLVIFLKFDLKSYHFKGRFFPFFQTEKDREEIHKKPREDACKKHRHKGKAEGNGSVNKWLYDGLVHKKSI